MVGSLFGDAHLERRGGGGSRLKFEQCSAHQDY
jgi:hypothetical protein